MRQWRKHTPHSTNKVYVLYTLCTHFRRKYLCVRCFGILVLSGIRCGRSLLPLARIVSNDFDVSYMHCTPIFILVLNCVYRRSDTEWAFAVFSVLDMDTYNRAEHQRAFKMVYIEKSLSKQKKTKYYAEHNVFVIVTLWLTRLSLLMSI